MTTNTTTSERPPADVIEAAKGLAGLLGRIDRPDLAARANAAGARVSRPGTIVCVVGEFKQGKSSLVNGLIRSTVCPVDDDLATSAITLVQYGETPSAVVRRTVGDERVADPVPLEEIGEWVSEQGNPGNHKGVERVDISVPSSLLEDGLVLVDTPGMGGLGGGHAAATMAFLPFADGLILVSDASAELSAPEVDFLHRATALCPTVIMAQTKIDLYPEWERIRDVNAGHLATHTTQIPIVAVSSTLRDVALRRQDKTMNQRSRFPDLVDMIRNRVVGPAKATAAERSRADIHGIVQLVRSGIEDEVALLDDPAGMADVMAEFERSKERLEYLRGPGAQWSVVLGDRITDLSTTVNHGFRSAMRSISRSTDERVELLKKGNEWEEMVRDLQTQVAEAAAEPFAYIQQSWSATHQEVADLLRDEQVLLPAAAGSSIMSIDVSELWSGTSGFGKGEKKGLDSVKSVIGIGQTYASTNMLFNSVGSISKFGLSLGALAAGPVVAGGFVVMGGVRVLEDRKRALATRRQKARQEVRQYIDDVQFEIGNEITNLIRQAQRDMRDGFSERLKELQTTYTATAQQAQADAKRSEAERAARRELLSKTLAALAQIEGRVGTGSML